MEGKHTPGPWTGHDGRIYIEGSDVRNMIATVHHPNSVSCYPTMDSSHQRLKDERDANTALIAAAPEMLSALELAVQALNTAPRFKVGADEHGVGGTDSYKIAAVVDAAIAKARRE